jgi:hypothetical protein
MHQLQAGEHVQCLDLIKVGVGNGAVHDCAILLEIWDVGGLIQTNIPIPAGASISLESVGEGIPAQVVSCEQDSYGFMVQISTGSRWFPEVYTPPHMILI